MQLSRIKSFFVLSLITAFILSACGGGGVGIPLRRPLLRRQPLRPLIPPTSTTLSSMDP